MGYGKKMWVRGKLWHVIRRSRSPVLLQGERSAAFSVEQGVAQGYM